MFADIEFRLRSLFAEAPRFSSLPLKGGEQGISRSPLRRGSDVRKRQATKNSSLPQVFVQKLLDSDGLRQPAHFSCVIPVASNPIHYCALDECHFTSIGRPGGRVPSGLAGTPEYAARLRKNPG